MITSRMIFRIYLFGLIAARVSNRDTNGLVDQQNDAQSTQHKNSTVTRRVNREAKLIAKKHAEVGHFTGQVTGGHDLEVLANPQGAGVGTSGNNIEALREHELNKTRILGYIARKKIEVKDICEMQDIFKEMATVMKRKGGLSSKEGLDAEARAVRFTDRLIDNIPNSRLDILRNETRTKKSVANEFRSFNLIMRQILLENFRMKKIPFPSQTSRESMRSSLKECTRLVVVMSAEIASLVKKPVAATKANHTNSVAFFQRMMDQPQNGCMQGTHGDHPGCCV